MKLIALAAALALGGTAIAQDAPQQSTTTTSQQPTTTPDSTMSTTDQSTGTTGAGTATADGTVEDPKGGYMPSTPALSGTPMPGQPVVFQAGRSPSEAFPAPAPLKKYPLCKKGQYDNCRQRGR